MVGEIRFQMYDASQTTLLLELFIQVDYHFSAHSVSNIILTPPPPAYFSFNQNVDISFDYTTDEAAGVRIFARPFTNGALTPNYAASGSPLYPAGSGSGTGSFTITSGDVIVDQIRFQMYDANQTTVLLEFFIPVVYQFGLVTDIISSEPTNPNDYSLLQNYPNPFNPTTKISFELPNSSNVTLRVYDILGNFVSELVNRTLGSGRHVFQFNSDGLSSGIYLYKLEAKEIDGKSSFVNVKKMILLK